MLGDLAAEEVHALDQPVDAAAVVKVELLPLAELVDDEGDPADVVLFEVLLYHLLVHVADTLVQAVLAPAEDLDDLLDDAARRVGVLCVATQQALRVGVRGEALQPRPVELRDVGGVLAQDLHNLMAVQGLREEGEQSEEVRREKRDEHKEKEKAAEHKRSKQTSAINLALPHRLDSPAS